MNHSSKWRLSRWLGRRSIRGTTLVEITVFLFISAVTIGYAVPNFQTFIIDNRTISGTNLVVSALNFARSEAIKRGMPVTACASSDYANCAPSIWHEGWMVFTDEPIAGFVDGPDDVLRTQQGIDLDITLVSGQNFIRFASNGSLADVGHGEDEFEGFASGPYEPSPLGTLIANLLPISSAYAASQSCNNGVGNGCSPPNPPPVTSQSKAWAVFEFKVCPTNKGYKGRTIEVSATGQIRTVEAIC